MNQRIKTYSLYIVSGIILTLISTLYTQDVTARLGVSTIGHGLPLPWLEQTTPIALSAISHYSLASYGLGLLADITFWSTIAVIIHSLYKRLRK